MLGYHVLLLLLFAWLTLFPTDGLFPQTSHTLDISFTRHRRLTVLPNASVVQPPGGLPFFFVTGVLQ